MKQKIIKIAKEKRSLNFIQNIMKRLNEQLQKE